MEALEVTDLEPIKINIGPPESSEPKTTNFGDGIELLMNDKNVSSSKGNVGLDDLNKLEDDLNELSSIKLDSSNFELKKDDFKFEEAPPLKVNFDLNDSKLGESTINSIGNQKTWDGFKKIDETPIFDREPASQNMSDREKRKKKRHMLKCIEQWQEKGYIKDNTRYNMDSAYEEIEDEYESAMDDKRKRDSVKIQQNWLITMVNTIEYGNAMFDPLGISLDGWGESVSEDIDSYNEIFEELHDKYKGGKLSPELNLLLRLGFSASVVHFSNKALSTAAPGFNDVIKQSPELMRMFTNATVDSMKQQSPGMAFAEELLNTKPDMTQGPPPAPMRTRDHDAPHRPGAMQFTQSPGNRPDLNMGRGNEGVEMRNETLVSESVPPIQPRPEMKGPRNTDIDNILSGLKTKPVDIHDKKDEDSVVSISSLKDLEGNTMPKKSKKRNISDRKIVSLDI
tara:strand:- start:80 stop:1438 length:1359 start_codon:yes stop_codon:yes gene_type:complete